jgi:hypothetical protein
VRVKKPIPEEAERHSAAAGEQVDKIVVLAVAHFCLQKVFEFNVEPVAVVASDGPA